MSTSFVIESVNKEKRAKSLRASLPETLSPAQTDATLTSQMIRAGIPIPLHVEICL